MKKTRKKKGLATTKDRLELKRRDCSFFKDFVKFCLRRRFCLENFAFFSQNDKGFITNSDVLNLVLAL